MSISGVLQPELCVMHGEGRLLNDPHYELNPQIYWHCSSFHSKHSTEAYNTVVELVGSQNHFSGYNEDTRISI
jgi:hypothetical protein